MSRCALLLPALLLAATVAPADPPDLTSQLEYLGNPNASRWPSASASVARHVQDLVPYKGRIYTSGGDWNNNTGPCPCFAVDPYSGAFTNEFDAGTDAIFEFKEFSDGRLYASAVDMHEGALHNGSSFRRGSNDVWTAYTTACTACNITNYGSGSAQGYRIHNWDMAEYRGYAFVCGYGISASTNWCETPMFDASPQLRDMNRPIPPIDYRSGSYRYTRLAVLRRFCAFLPFDDDVFCFPIQPVVTNDIQHCDWEEWRWDESSRTFLSGPNAWENVAPGITEEAASFSLSSNAYNEVQFWHPTKFGARVLYILGEHGCNNAPWAAYSAANENHHVKATKIDLGGDDVKPFDVCVADGAAYLVAAQAGLRATMVTNSVWKSTDGVSFEKLFTFVSTRQASAICYYDGCFYLGMGSSSETRYAWPKVTGTDVSGRIYRVRLPQHEAVRAVAEPASVTIFEGDSADVSFRLDSAPATNMTLRVWTTNPRIAASVQTLAFTPSDWNVPKTVRVTVLDDEVEFAVRGAVVCGTGGPDCFSGAAIVESVEDDGDLTTPTSGGVTAQSKPYRNNTDASRAFDGNRIDTNGRWVAVYTNHMYAVYRFNEPTAVNMVRVWNGDDDHGGWSSAKRSPKDWTFQGSHDGVNWTILDARTNETGWSANGESRDYSFTNDTAYAYYKFDCTELNGATDYLQIWELDFFYRGSGGTIVLPDAIRIGAPDGGDEPPRSIVANQQGAECLRVVLAEAVPGPYYTPFATESLAERPVAAADSTTVAAAGPLPFEIPTEGRASLFVSIAASDEPFAAGDELP